MILQEAHSFPLTGMPSRALYAECNGRLVHALQLPATPSLLAVAPPVAAAAATTVAKHYYHACI
jgi:hypothetical protein